MKVALLYNYPLSDYYQYGKERFWSTPRGIYDAFASTPGVVEVRSFPLPPEKQIFGFVELKKLYDRGEFVPDILLLMNAGSFYDDIWSKAFFPKSMLVYEAGDEPQTFSWNQLKASRSDLVLTPDYRCYHAYKNQMKVKAVWTAHWADSNIFFPSHSPTPFDVVTSCGDRGDVTHFLQAELRESFHNRLGLVDIENGDLYRSGKIAFQKSRFDEVTRRIFEGLACRKLVVTDKISQSAQLETLFKDGEEIVLYSSAGEALEKIRYYLQHSVERERIAFNGFQKVVSRHTAQHLVRHLVKEFAEFSHGQVHPMFEASSYFSAEMS